MVAPATPAALARDPALPPGQDFDALKAEAIANLQQLCAGWTDYNTHDPGVTLVELLSYALTDLGYRATLPVEDLLAGASLGGREGLYPAWRALPSPPVTVADFRRVLLDRVEGLGNVWLTPRNAPAGLYDVRIHAALPLPGVHPEQHLRYRELARRVRRAFERHRPICEDIGTIRVLRPLRTLVRAELELELERGARAEAVMAEALFRLAIFLAPEPRRTPLDAQAAAAALDGPLLLRGLIAPGELTDKPATIDPDALAEVLRETPGVLRVRECRLWLEGTGECEGPAAIDPEAWCSLDAGIEEDALPLALSIGGRPCAIDRGEVLRRLLRRWEAHRASWPLEPAYRQAFALRTGMSRALARIAPLGPQLPRVYGLATPDKPDTPAAVQLEGFLKIFETVMADFCTRLGATSALAGGTIAFALPPPQQEKLLDMLLALYGVPADIIPTPPRFTHRGEAAARRRVAIKQTLLDHRGALARRRARGFDPEARGASRRRSGLELYASLLLGTRVCLIEHMMLRPRTRARRALEGSRYEYAMAVSVAITLPEDERRDHRYRGEIEAAIRVGLPAHIGLHMHFVEPARWRRLRDVERLWRAALRVDARHAADQLAVELRDLLERWTRRERERE
ncbi:hypothetical protein E5A73_08355 [Sphingomonas gei]|uniref:Uncharacterized protein n=1 Tax=Sphingomonas gei TaxID=1395960 RepID=A0A4S1XER4_9SPHN|nr:hypothetical protein [Sphingomonas gei]TGX54123.1 hypothetical protein E5A73_08355 [Sphingomonas gei]